jgi:hypothetical protein
LIKPSTVRTTGTHKAITLTGNFPVTNNAMEKATTASVSMVLTSGIPSLLTFLGPDELNDRELKGNPNQKHEMVKIPMYFMPHISSLDNQDRVFRLPYNLLRYRSKKHFLKVGLPMGANDNSRDLLFSLNL